MSPIEIAIIFDKTKLSIEEIEVANHLLQKLNDTLAPTESLINENDRYIQFFHDSLNWHDESNNTVYAFRNFIKLLNEDSYRLIKVGDYIGGYEVEGKNEIGLSIIYQVSGGKSPCFHIYKDSLPLKIK